MLTICTFCCRIIFEISHLLSNVVYYVKWIIIIMCTTNITKGLKISHTQIVNQLLVFETFETIKKTRSFWIFETIKHEFFKHEFHYETSNKAQQQAKIFSEQARTLKLWNSETNAGYKKNENDNTNTMFDFNKKPFKRLIQTKIRINGRLKMHWISALHR